MPGYRFGLRQPSVSLNMHFSVPEKLDFKVLDRWISEALETDVATYQPIYLTGINESAIPVQYLRRLLLVANVLCQDVRIPLFERAVITNVDDVVEAVDIKTADLCFPLVDGFEPNISIAWLKISQKFVLDICHCLVTSKSTNQVYARLQREHVIPWLSKISGGKSTIPLLQGAFESGISFAYCGAGSYVLGWGSESLMFDRSSNDRDSAIGSRMSHHKGVMIQLMKKGGIPVPNGVVCRVASFSIGQVEQFRFPLVVKPVDRDRGEGVTLGIRDSLQLTMALDAAAKFSSGVLVEEEVAGTCHRILVVDGQVIFVVKRNPRSLVGDGHQTIAALVACANEARLRKLPQKRLPEYVLDDLAMEALVGQGLTADSIPFFGQKIRLRPAQSTLWGGDPEPVTTMLHPDNGEIAVRAANMFGLSCAGVDLISPDISVPWYENGAVINEVNYSPVMGRTYEYQRLGVRAYLKKLFPGGGRIPMEIYVGPRLDDVVFKRQNDYAAQGVTCFVSLAHKVVDERWNTYHMAGAWSQPEQIGMLQANRRVGALLVYVEDSADFLRLGLPFDYVTRVVSAPWADLEEPQKRMIGLAASYLPKGRAVEMIHAG